MLNPKTTHIGAEGMTIRRLLRACMALGCASAPPSWCMDTPAFAELWAVWLHGLPSRRARNAPSAGRYRVSAGHAAGLQVVCCTFPRTALM